jgi:ABC-type phosphate/phosphonate transport system substrate-binding protein
MMHARLYLLTALILQSWGNGNAEIAAEEGVGLGEKRFLDIAYSASLFYNVDVNDALAATAVWAQSILREKTSDDLALNAFIVQDGSELIQAYRAGKADLIVTNPLEYLAISDSIVVQPVLLGASEAGPLDEFILLVNGSSNIGSLDMLQGKELIMEVAARGDLPTMWLDILLLMNGLPAAAEHMPAVRRVDKTGQAVLPVFFRQAEACVVTRRAFELMVELNPQLGKELVELYSSPGYSRTLVCLNPDLVADDRQLLEETLMALHEDP